MTEFDFDVSELSQATGRKATPHDNCVVLDLGSGAFPRDIEVRLPDDDGARQIAVWDGSLNLSINDEVFCTEYGGNPKWRVSAMGGADSGAGKVRVNKVWAEDFSSESLVTDASDNVTINTGTLTLPSKIIHLADTDTEISFTDDDIEFTAGNLSMLKLTEAGQDVVAIGDVAGGGDVDIDFNDGQVFLRGSDGRMAIATTVDSETRLNIKDVSTTTGSRDLALHAEIDTTNDTTAVYVSHAVRGINRYRGTQGSTSPTGPNAFTGQMLNHNTGTTAKISGFRLDQRNLGAGTVTAMSGILIDTMQNTGGGAVTSTFGIRIEAQTVGTNNFGIYQLGTGSDNYLAGSLGVGVVFPLAKAHIDQLSTTAAIPTLSLDQADLSEEFINFITSIGAGNPIDTAAIGTYYGKVRVAVNGTFKYMALYNS